MRKILTAFILLIAVVLIAAALIQSNILLHGTLKINDQIVGYENPFTHLSPQQFSADLAKNRSKLIDIRTRDEYDQGHIAGAENVDFNQTQNFSDYLDAQDKTTRFLIYCRTDSCSQNAMQLMQNKGFAHVNDLTGGYDAWVNAGFPVEQ